MSHPSNSTDNTATPTNDIAEAESSKTQQAAAKATTQVADVMAPETIVVDEPPPQPDYPRYRVRPGEPIELAELDSDASEHYKKKKMLKKNLSISDRALRIYKSGCMLRTNAAY